MNVAEAQLAASHKHKVICRFAAAGEKAGHLLSCARRPWQVEISGAYRLWSAVSTPASLRETFTRALTTPRSREILPPRLAHDRQQTNLQGAGAVLKKNDYWFGGSAAKLYLATVLP